MSTQCIYLCEWPASTNLSNFFYMHTHTLAHCKLNIWDNVGTRTQLTASYVYRGPFDSQHRLIHMHMATHTHVHMWGFVPAQVVAFCALHVIE